MRDVRTGRGVPPAGAGDETDDPETLRRLKQLEGDHCSLSRSTTSAGNASKRIDANGVFRSTRLPPPHVTKRAAMQGRLARFFNAAHWNTIAQAGACGVLARCRMALHYTTVAFALACLA